MSEWKHINAEDISINDDDETLEVLIDTNNFGNVYVEIDLADIDKLFTKYMAHEIVEMYREKSNEL